jgi:hypothetical protein
MNRRISLDQLPRKLERLLRTTWEEHECVLLELNDEPVAAVVPMSVYRQLSPESSKKETTKPQLASSLEYDLPDDLLEDYHRLVRKELMEGLTPDEKTELERIDKELNEADMQTPLEQAIDTRARHEHEQRMRALDDIITQLKSLENS